jgi:hypothetical protein
MPDPRITRPCEVSICDDSTTSIEVQRFGDYAWFVVCGHCGTCSFWADTQEEAIAIWNDARRIEYEFHQNNGG